MSGMVERVARAIYQQSVGPVHWGKWDAFAPDAWGRVKVMAQARAAIEAMSDLTGDEMIFMKGGDVPPSSGSRFHTTKRIGDLAAKRVWETMIDAALKE